MKTYLVRGQANLIPRLNDLEFYSEAVATRIKNQYIRSPKYTGVFQPSM